MNIDHESRPLESLFTAHLENSIECGQTLGHLFDNLLASDSLIAQISQMETLGDALTSEAYRALEGQPYSEQVYLTQQFAKHLDDIVDGINNTARIIDIFMPDQTEEAAQRILATIMKMATHLLTEVQRYPSNTLETVRQCREALKLWEEEADLIYHDWRKSHRRHSSLSLISEMDWTEILGILEGTTDACYHSALLLERITRDKLSRAYV